MHLLNACLSCLSQNNDDAQLSLVVAPFDPKLNGKDSDCDPSSSSEDSDSEDEMLDPETATSIVAAPAPTAGSSTATSIVAAQAPTAGSSPTEDFGRAAQVAAMAWCETNTSQNSRLQTLFP